MSDEYQDLKANLWSICPDYKWEEDEWPVQAIKCHGWLLTDFDTWEMCPRHYVEEQRHPEDEMDEEEERGDPAPQPQPHCLYKEVEGNDEDIPF